MKSVLSEYTEQESNPAACLEGQHGILLIVDSTVRYPQTNTVAT